MISEEQLDGWLAEERRREPGIEPRTAVDCISFARARAMAANAALMTRGAEAHLASCHTCRARLAAFRAEMPHLPLTLLIARELRDLTDAERRRVEFHLERGACELCRERTVRVGRLLPEVAWGSGRLILPTPAAAAGASAPAELLAASAGGGLEAELHEERGTVVLEVRTRVRGLGRALVRYELAGATGANTVRGFLVLDEDVEGWYAASLAWDVTRLRSHLGESCSRVVVFPVLEAELLAPEEVTELLACARDAVRDPGRSAAWMRWLRSPRHWAPGAAAEVARLLGRGSPASEGSAGTP